jgi:hypothetical protein
MNTVYKALITATISLVIAGPVFADYAGHHRYGDNDSESTIDHRLKRQHNHIKQGFEQQRLSHKETKILKRNLLRIKHLAREYQEDGQLSQYEFMRLTRKLDMLSDLTWEYKHNDLVRYMFYHDKYALKRGVIDPAAKFAVFSHKLPGCNETSDHRCSTL